MFLRGCFLAETPIVPLDFEQIASDIHFRHQIVEQCIHETLLLFADALLDKKDVEFFFKDIGLLTVQRKVVAMYFNTEFLLELNDKDKMLKALLTVSGSRLRGCLQLWQCCQSSLKLLSPCLPCHWVRQTRGAIQTLCSSFGLFV